MALQAADNPLPQGQANITAVKFPGAFADCPITGNYSTCYSLSDVALVFLDGEFEHTLQFGFDTALEGNETIYTAGAPLALQG